jgi:four helix bundle protein
MSCIGFFFVLLFRDMKYSRFEELPVWNTAIEFALKVFEFTNAADFRGLGDTKSQLERAALSISNNVAEGFERGTTNDLIHFLYISRGSAGESRSMLRLCERVERFSNFRSEISNLNDRAVSISKQLHGWIDSLKDSGIRGVRHFDRQAKHRVEQDKKFEEFDREMAKHQEDLLAKLKERELQAERDQEQFGKED